MVPIVSVVRAKYHQSVLCARMAILPGQPNMGRLDPSPEVLPGISWRGSLRGFPKKCERVPARFPKKCERVQRDLRGSKKSERVPRD